jgi:hypothetical protein
VTNFIKFSEIIESNGRTIRENNLTSKHKYPIDELVEVKYDEYFGNDAGRKIIAHMYVVAHDRDCDGTPLYTVATKRRSEWDVSQTGRDFEIWRNQKFTAASLLIEAVYRPVHGLGEDQLTAIKPGLGTPHW